MIIAITGVVYIAACFMCLGLGDWSPKVFPHCQSASKPQQIVLSVLPVVLLIVLGGVLGSLVNVTWWWYVDIIIPTLFLALTLDAFRRTSVAAKARGDSAGGGKNRDSGDGTESGEEIEETPPYILVVAPEADLIGLEADFRLSDQMGKTPFRDIRIAAVDAAQIIFEAAPSSVIIPWPEVMNEKVFVPHMEETALCQEKIAEAMASESSKMAAELENQELSSKLSEALDANHQYERVLQDLRSRPAASTVDFTKMSHSQRVEEEKRLKDALRTLQDILKAQPSQQISIPSYLKGA